MSYGQKKTLERKQVLPVELNEHLAIKCQNAAGSVHMMKKCQHLKDAKMKKVLVAYYSRTGLTEKMAEYIAEGVRFSGNDAQLKKITDIRNERDLDGYDGFIFGCPTYHKDMTNNFKTFLFLAQKGPLQGKLGGAFGSSTHSGEAPGLIFDTMEFVFEMKMTNLGPFELREKVVGVDEGTRACQEYGKAIGDELGS